MSVDSSERAREYADTEDSVARHADIRQRPSVQLTCESMVARIAEEDGMKRRHHIPDQLVRKNQEGVCLQGNCTLRVELWVGLTRVVLFRRLCEWCFWCGFHGRLVAWLL